MQCNLFNSCINTAALSFFYQIFRHALLFFFGNDAFCFYDISASGCPENSLIQSCCILFDLKQSYEKSVFSNDEEDIADSFSLRFRKTSYNCRVDFLKLCKNRTPLFKCNQILCFYISEVNIWFQLCFISRTAELLWSDFIGFSRRDILYPYSSAADFIL